MDEDAEQNVIVSTVTITRRYYPQREHAEDRDVVTVDTSDQLTLLETLGLLEFAKLSTAAGMLDDDPDEDR